MKISRIGVMKQVTVGILLISVLLFGLYSLSGMNLEFFGNISTPEIKVAAIYPGASAEDVKKDVVEIMEDDFATIPGLKEVTSQCTNSLGIITITFQDGIDPYDQLGEVRNRISDLSGDLPENLQGTPKAIVGGAELLPVISFTVEGGSDILSVSEYIKDTLKPRITKIPGVSSVTISGDQELRIDIKIRTEELASKGISPLTVYQILSYSNIGLPIGTIDYKNKSVDLRYDGTYSSIEEIRDLPVGSDDDGRIIHLSDIADIRLIPAEAEYYVSSRSGKQLLVEICKRSDGNTVTIANSIKKILKSSEAETRNAIKYNMVQDDSRLVKASLRTVISSGVIGIIVAIFVVYIFIGDLTATFIIGLSIPLSLLFTFIAMRLTGISINLMSLAGTVVALGSIIGGSIVILEQVYKYYSDKSNPLSLNNSIFKGTDEVAGSVLGSTMTTIVVFIPIAMLSGLIGKVLHDISLTFIYAMTASLVVAIVVVPYLMKLILKDNVNERKTIKKTLFLEWIGKLEKVYESSVRWALDCKYYIILLSFMLLGFTIYSFSSLTIAFIPSTDNDDFYVTLEFPSGYSLEETSNEMSIVKRIITENIPEIENVVYFTGKSDDLNASSVATDNMGYAHIVLSEVKKRKRGIHEIILSIQKLLEEKIPDATVKVTNGGFDRLVSYVSDGGGYGLTLVGEDSELLYKTAVHLQGVLQNDPEVRNTSINTSFDRRSAVVDMSYEYLSSLGVTSYEAGVTSMILFKGMDINNKFSDDNKRYDIHIYSDIKDQQLSDETLANINVVSQAGNTISFPSISQIREEKTMTQVNRKDRANTLTVSAILTGESTSGVTARMNKYIAENPLPNGVEVQTGGIGQFINEAIGPMITALLIAIFLVYVVMVIQFSNYGQPILVMLTIPFCIIGVIIALVFFNSTLSLLSMLGIISLAGMVVNNGILIIDYTNMTRKNKRISTMRERGIQFEDWDTDMGKLSEEEERIILSESIAPATASRLRPILMTTLSTMLGVVPMAVSKGEGAEIFAPLGQSIAGGLLSASLVTMYLIPVIYYLLESNTISRKYRKSKDKIKEAMPESAGN